MKIIELKNNEIIEILKNGNVINHGQFGLLIEINENIIFKFYYKDFFKTYEHPIQSTLDKEIDLSIEIEQFLIETGCIKETKLNRMFQNFKRLEGTKSENLIKGIVTYKKYPVGIILNNYKEYRKLTQIYKEFDKKDRERIILKIKDLLNELYEHGVYPIDLKEDNILIKEDNLDIVIVDLDGSETRFEDKEYIKEIPHIKQNVKNRYDAMVKRLNKF
jgi:serine/threonine protein kinase